MIATDDNSPLRPVCDAWLSLIKKAREHRHEQFGKTAELLHRLYTECHDFVYQGGGDLKGYGGKEIPAPSWMMTVNKVVELVDLFGPHLYHKNPHRHVLGVRQDLPDGLYELLYGFQAPAVIQQREMLKKQDEATAGVLSVPLNYLPREFDLKRESLLSINEALVDGAGFLFHEMHVGADGSRLPRTYHASWRKVFIDPDADAVKDAKWVALECTAPHFEVEKEYQHAPGSLKKAAKGESATRQGQMDSDPRGELSRKQGISHDLVTYYKVWSKTGMGHRLSAPMHDEALGVEGSKLREVLEPFGEYCFLAVCEGVPYPLNVPPDVQNAQIEAAPDDPMAAAAQANKEDLYRRVRWPVPFYLDEGGWPFAELGFHHVSGDLWPTAHLKAGIGHMLFLDWAMSWLTGRIKDTGRTLIFGAGHTGEEIEQAIRRGSDLQYVKLDGVTRSIKECIEMFTFPEVNEDAWKILDAVAKDFERLTGLNDLLYGMAGKQMRSASEAQMREQAVSTRPDDMADKVEDWQRRAARNEALMLRWMCPPEVVAPIFREQFDPTGMAIGPATRWWAQFVYAPYDPLNPEAAAGVTKEFEYTIESGSVRRPDLARDQANADLAAQTWIPVLQGYFQMTGDPGPFNGFAKYWGDVHQMDPRVLMLPPLPPPPPPVPVGPDGQPVQEQPQDPQMQGAF